jgi:peptidoglycan/LPS O-acetylase OafA/YrhL
LPGVFEENPARDVNGQLWTIRWELFSYVALTACAALSIHKNRSAFLAILIASHVAFPLVEYLGIYKKAPAYALTVVTCFLAGVFLYLGRATIPLRGRLAATATAAIVGLQALDPRLILLLPLPIAYVVVYLGCQDLKRVWLVSSGDYSYGIFLYHRQVQQTLWLFVPVTQSWYGSFALSLLVTFMLAYLSWHLVEKRALALRYRLIERDRAQS